MNKNKIILKSCESISGYRQLIEKTHNILTKHFDCLHLPIFNNTNLKQNYELLDSSFDSCPELIITSLPGDPYNTILSSISKNKNCILLSMWESTRLTGWHLRELENFSKILVPSKWNFDCFINSGIKSVEKLNLFVDTDIFFGRPKIKNLDKFIFISGGSELYSTGNNLRKDLPKILHLFSQEFPKEKDVELWIKLSKNDFLRFPKFIDERIKVFSHFSDEIEYADFLSCGDAFISPSKSEGWGFMQIESLSIGRPIISQHYSALTEFLTFENSFAVKYKEVLASANWGKNGGLWSEIDENSMKKQLRYCYENKNILRQNWANYSSSVDKFNLKNYERNLLSLLK